MIQYLISIFTIGALGAILCLGLNVRWGWSGDFDLAFYAMVAIGAYMGGVTVLPKSALTGGSGWILGLNQNFFVGALVAIAATSLVSLVLGWIALRRLRGDYLGITTVAFSLIITAVFTQEQGLFNGFNGLYSIPSPFADQFDAFTYPLVFLIILLVALAIVYTVLELLYRSPWGLGLRIVREDEIAAAAFGRNVFKAKLTAYVLGGAVAGLGGFLFANYLTAWNPATWNTIEVFILYSAIFLGGSANQIGVLLGAAVVLIAVPEGTRFLPNIPGHPDLFPAVRGMISGLLILLVLRFRPQGLVPERRPRDLLRRRRPVAAANVTSGPGDGQRG
ncbi:MAG: branched-chain amino acid ABC transporter permease [Candidatus Dormibacteraeota bacterium]|nr:branched-chain amino acid ABC transporter permease [Candidatus Dormibacteraeota bacterium]